MLCSTIVSDFENNLILYFFSAMPQVLGTMLALLGAFYPTKSNAIRNDIITIYNSSRTKLIEFNKSGGLYRLWYKEANDLKESANETETKIIEDIYVLGPHNNNLEDQFVASYSETNSDSVIDQIFQKLSRFFKIYSNDYFEFIDRKKEILKEYKNSADFNPSKFKVIESSSYFNNSEFEDILSSLGIVNAKFFLYKKMKKTIKEIFILNGIVLGFFILSFLFLKFTENSVLAHFIFLSVGVFLATTSAYSMIYYVYNSVSERVQTSLFGFSFRKKCNDLFLWIKDKVKNK